MAKECFNFLSSDGKTQIAAYRYSCGRKPKAILQLCHGMCEYIGRYDGFAGYMAEQGYAVFAHDHLGHGGSAPSKNELGYFAEQDGDRILVEDVHLLGEIARGEFPGVRYILFGHSMGSIVVRNYLLKYGGEVDACSLCGTIGPLKMGGLSKRIARGQIARHGGRARGELLTKLAFGSYNKRIKGAASANAWLTREREIVEAYEADPYCNFHFTNAAFLDLIAMSARISKKDWAEGIPKGIPYLIISGEEDPCGGYGKGVREICRRMAAAGVKQIDLKIYPGARHELLNERCREEVTKDIFSWCEGLTPKEER